MRVVKWRWWTWQGQGEGRLVCSVEYKTGENGAAFKDRIGRNSTYSLPLSLVHSSFQCVADKGRKYGACDEGRKWLISSKMLLNFLSSGEFALIQVTSTKVVWMVERIWGFVNWLIWCKWSDSYPHLLKHQQYINLTTSYFTIYKITFALYVFCLLIHLEPHNHHTILQKH